MQRMRHHVMDHNIYRWAASILSDLHELRLESPAAGDLIPAQPASDSLSEVADRKLAT
jgi:trehalose-6-phosphate synthase